MEVLDKDEAQVEGEAAGSEWKPAWRRAGRSGENGLLVGFGVSAGAGAGALLSCLEDGGRQPVELLGSAMSYKESQMWPRRDSSMLAREPVSGARVMNGRQRREERATRRWRGNRVDRQPPIILQNITTR